MAYKDIKLKTPDDFKNKFIDKSVLIISSGHSTGKIVNRKNEIRDRFDVIMVVNYAFQYFDDIVDFHLVVEKTSKSTKNNFIHRLLREGDYRKDTPRIVNWKGIDLYDKRYNLCKTTRNNFNGDPNIREYIHAGHEGLLSGPVSSQGFALGSVTLSAMHLASIMGSNNIYLIGSEFVFRDHYDHFYKDRMYRDDQDKVKSKQNRHIIVDVEQGGNIYKTTKYFAESAKYVGDVINNKFKPQGINVFDFSDGLIETDKIDIDDFLKQ